MEKFIADSNAPERDRFFRRCSHLGVPFVKARRDPGTGNYAVQVDMATCGAPLSAGQMEGIAALFEAEESRLRPSGAPRAGSRVDGELTWFDGVPPSRLDSFCGALYDMARPPGGGPPPARRAPPI